MVYSLFFILGFLTYGLGNYIKTKVTKIRQVKNMNSLYSEILFSISKSKFVTRVNSNVTLDCVNGTLGSFSLLYMIDRGDIAVFRDGRCLYTSDSVDSDIIERIIKKINEQYKNQINDIVTVFGFIFSREDFETKFKMRVENGMLYPLDKKDESDIDKIKSKNSEMFNIDDILDKINDVGIDSLSNEERAFLKSFKS